jgi:hypothetical protein
MTMDPQQADEAATGSPVEPRRRSSRLVVIGASAAASALALFVGWRLYETIARGFAERNHDVLGPLCEFLLLMVVAAPVVSGVAAWFWARKWVAAAVVVGLVVSFFCFLASLHIGIEYIAG